MVLTPWLPQTLPTPATLGSIVVLGVACTAGVLVLSEHLGVMSLVGLLLILCGSWISTK